MLIALVIGSLIASAGGLVTIAKGQDAPIANTDTYFAQPVGTPLTMDVLSNDVGGPGASALDPTSVRLLNPNDLSEVTTWAEAGEGQWSVDIAAGTVIFTGCTGEGVPFAELCTGPFEGEAFPMEYIVRNLSGVASNPAQIYVSLTVQGAPIANADTYFGRPVGTPLTMDVLSNDLGGPGLGALDPTSIRLLNPDDLTEVTTWAEAGEGNWTVDTAAGTVTFTGCTGEGVPFAELCTGLFEGEALPMQYIVRNLNGIASKPAQIYVSLTVQDENSSSPVFLPLVRK